MEEKISFLNEDGQPNVDAVLEMMEAKQFSQLRELLSEFPAADLAELFLDIPDEKDPLLFRILPKEIAADVFVEMDTDAQERLLYSFSDRELGEVLSELYMDDTVDIIEEMPANVVARILRLATPEARKQINELLKYPEDSAGSVMTTEFVRLRKDMTVEDAFLAIRRVAIDKETVYTCYVTDEARHLEGVITVKKLLLSEPDALLSEIMEENVVSLETHTDREEVALAFNKYGFLALPVVDAENRLVGIITMDDALDVMHEEAEEDFAVMAAVTPTEDPYLRTGVFRIFASRIPWLLILMLSATFTGMIISGFESALAACVALTAFIPMLMGTGGNSGSQSSTTVIRGISLGEIEFKDTLRVLFKELRVSILCGVCLAIATFAKVMLVDAYMMGNPQVTPTVALVVSLTLLVTVIAAKLIGCLLPIIAKKVHLDPAVMASPFITTLVDAVSLLVYFAIAHTFLGI
ncbi:MAG: magnesium transporter [Ruminococcaceae bacterium]|nr:magnesium transporter [Oscillospiraceae bacterium]